MLINYIKIAWKVLLRHPFYTFITLFGITVTLTVLMVLTSFLDHLIGDHYPEEKRSRSLYIWNLTQQDSARTSMQSGPMSYTFLKDYVKTLKTPAKVGICSMTGASNTYVNGKRIKVSVKYCDPDFWEVGTFRFLEGKPFNDLSIRNNAHEVVITDQFRKDYFGDEETQVVGKSIEIENQKYRITGVIQSSPITRFMTYSEVYFPYNMPKSNFESKGFRGNFYAIVLASEKSDLPRIQEEFNSVIARLPLPAMEGSFKYDIIDVTADKYVDNVLKPFFRASIGNTFYVIIGLIMLMLMGLPAINLINLNVSRIMERASEIGIRKAFGAPSKTLAWQFIVENIFITLIGGFMALVLTLIVITVFNASGLIHHADLVINFSVFGVSLLVCFVFGLLSGVVPALRMSKMKVIDALKSV